jgi:hypothetical protein
MRSRVRQLRAALALVSLGVGLYVAVSTIVMIVWCWGPLPKFDSWDELVSGRGITWSWLISQHNEHRMFFPRLVEIADYWLAAERGVVDLVAGGIELGGVALLIIFLSRDGLRGRSATIWTVGLVLALLLWAAQYETLTWGLPFVQFWGVSLFATAAFSTLVLGSPTPTNVALVSAFGVAATYTMASGIIVPFAALVLAFWMRRPRRQVAMLTAVAVLTLASYLVHYQTPGQVSDPLTSLSHPWSVLVYAAAYLGGPFGAAAGLLFGIPSLPPAILLGAIAAAIFAVLVWTLFRNRSVASPQEAALLALAGMVGAEAFITALGRIRFGATEALSSRYATHVVLFWLAITLAAAWRMGPGRQFAVAVLSIPALLIIAVSQPGFAAIAADAAGEVRSATAAVLADVADPILLKVYPNIDVPLQRRAVLRAAHTSVFADTWSRWLNTPLASHVAIVDGASCRGAFDRAVRVIASAHSGWRAVGTAWQGTNRRALSRIVLVGRAGVVRGYGLGGFSQGTVAMLARGGPKYVWWIGAFAGSDPATITAYALLKNAACPLGMPKQTLVATVSQLSNKPQALPPGGYIGSVVFSPTAVTIAGWGFLKPDGATMMIDTNLALRSHTLAFFRRPDVVSGTHDNRLAYSGFRIRLELDDRRPQPRAIRLCIWTEDPRFGRHLVNDPPRPDLCPPGAP